MYTFFGFVLCSFPFAHFLMFPTFRISELNCFATSVLLTTPLLECYVVSRCANQILSLVRMFWNSAQSAVNLWFWHPKVFNWQLYS